MSYRMCAKCLTVMDNGISGYEDCSECGSLDMADPLVNNREWDIIYRLQKNNFILRTQIKVANDVFSEIQSRATYTFMNLPKIKWEDMKDSGGLTGYIWDEEKSRITDIIKCTSEYFNRWSSK